MMTSTTTPRSKQRIFISHNKADNDLGYWLADELRRILNDREAVWYDSRGGRYNSKSGIRPGDDWPNEITKNIRSSNIFLLLWSNSAKNADWVRYELTIAKKRYVEGKIRILPIRIDACKLPIDLETIQYIDYVSGGNYQHVLDAVLQFLKLPPETDDLKIRAGNRKAFEVQEAFKNKEWSIVNQQFSLLSDLYPETNTSLICYMQAIALLERGHRVASLEVANKGLILDTNEQPNSLLYEYANLLIKKQCWKEIFALTTEAIQRFPEDPSWYPLHEQAYLNNKQASTTPPASQTGLLVSRNSMNGLPTVSNNIEKIPLYSAQQAFSTFNPMLSNSPNIPPLTDLSSPSSSIPSEKPRTDDTTQLLSDPNTEEYNFDFSLSPHPTRILTDEEHLQEENIQQAENQNSWQRTETFIEQHLHHHNLGKRLWTFSWVITLIMNMLAFLLIFSIIVLPAWITWISIAATLLILAWGKLEKRKAIGLLLALIPFSIIWGVVGYCISSFLYHQLRLPANTPTTNWLGATCSISLWAVGLSWHQSLFRKHNP